MVAIISVIVMCAIVGFCVWEYGLSPAMTLNRKGERNAVYIIGIIAASFAVHIICAASYHGHNTDMGCFTAWADMVFNDGIGNFYSSDAFTDYPPGYMYILYIIGAIKHFINPSGAALDVLIKFPAILCDIGTGFFIYKFAKKKFSDGISAVIAAIYLFNPAAILNSSLWGQVDSVYTLVLLAMIYCISEKKLIQSYFLFAACIFIKPQAFIFTPLLIFGIIENVFMPGFNKELFVKNLVWGLGAIIALVLVSLPFGFGNVFHQYTETLASYPYLTVNAFNLWGALGQNWTGLSAITSIIGYVILALIVAYSAYMFFKSKNPSKYYFVGAFLSFATFMLSTKMHDRYAFPTMALMLMAFIVISNFKNYLLYFLVALSQFFNTAWVLFIYEQDINLYFKSPVVVIASIVNVLVFAYMVYLSQTEYAANMFEVSGKVSHDKLIKAAKVSGKKMNKEEGSSIKFFRSEKFLNIVKFDVIAICVITVVYAGIALYNLGDMSSPETETWISDGAVTMDFGSDKEISKIKFFLGARELGEERPLEISFKNNSGTEVKKENLTEGSVFYWSEHDENVTARYITLSTSGTELSMKEFTAIDENGNIMEPVNMNDFGVFNISDEQELVPERSTFKNSTYFDEIYHARTAYEFLHNLSVYEWTHPPLGKVIMSLGILIFGMNPFGWRIAGTVIGILMIPPIYIFAKRLTNKSWIAVVTSVIFTFDFMHFAQTRIATIDVYVTFFIILMYLFMYKYYRMSFYDTPFKKTLIPLALSGICMGLGIASKWTGAYAGAGLAVLFFITMYRRYKEYLYALKNPSKETDGIKHEYVIKNFKPYMIKTFAWCCLFFVAVPFVIYTLSYIPYMMTPSGNGIKTIFENAESMFVYHSSTVLDSTHPFSSRWYEWIIMKRPIWYYSGTVSDTVKEGISSFGNPLVWWALIPAFVYLVYRIFKQKDKKAMFLIIAYLAQLVSWIPVTRLTFIYHYFPCVPFIVLMIGYCILCIYNDAKNKKAVIYGAFIYMALVIVLFAIFYPVLSGYPCSSDYAENWLKWFDSWVLL